MRQADLSVKSVDLMEVSRMLTKRVVAPQCMMKEVGEHEGRFYMLDWVTNRVDRLTLGAFRHLSNAWSVCSQ